MSWLIFYGSVALVVAVLAFVAADWVRDRWSAAPDRPGVYALATGAVWPLILLGVLQVAAVVGAQRLLSRGEIRPEPMRGRIEV